MSEYVLCMKEQISRVSRLCVLKKYFVWFKKHKRCWPNFTAFVAKAQIRVTTLTFGLLV